MIRSKIEGLLGFFSSSLRICVTKSVGGKRMGIFGDGIDARSVCAGEIWTVRLMLAVGSEPSEASWIRIGSSVLLSCGLDSSLLIRPGIWSQKTFRPEINTGFLALLSLVELRWMVSTTSVLTGYFDLKVFFFGPINH